MKWYLRLWAGLVFSIVSGVTGAQTVHGAGSSAAAQIYRAWAHEYQRSAGVEVSYDSVGSTMGLKRIKAREIAFGASDVAPSEAELSAAGLVVFPIAITGIVPVINLPKIGDGQLRLTGEVLARIYLGEIVQWNAPEIAHLNPDLALPNLAIKVVVRSEGSGTTYNFADYLAKVSAVWRDKRGVESRYEWPQSFVAVKGSEGMAVTVEATPGAIGYVDFDYVDDHRLNPIQLRNAEKDFVLPSAAAFRIALSRSEWSSKGKFSSTLTDMPGKGSWPITMGTFVLVPQVADKPEETKKALAFFVWAFTHGDALVQKHNFVRLPDRVQALAFRTIASVKDKSGRLIGLGL